jgi:hypothetical protein
MSEPTGAQPKRELVANVTPLFNTLVQAFTEKGISAGGAIAILVGMGAAIAQRIGMPRQAFVELAGGQYDHVVQCPPAPAPERLH